MKVAVCMYGLLRTYNNTAASLIKHVLEPNNADLFIFSPNRSGKFTLPKDIDINLYKSQNKSLILDMDSDGDLVIQDDLYHIYGKYLKGIHLYEPEKSRFDFDVSNIAMNDILIPSRVMSLFYNMSGAVSLATSIDSDYDIIILLRPDLAFYSPISVQSLSSDEIHIPLGGGKLNDGKENPPIYHVGYYKNTARGELIQAHKNIFTDQVIVFHKDSISSIVKLFDNVKIYLERGVPFHPETILFYALSYEQNKKVCIHDEWLYEIVRDNTNLIENDDILANLFRNSLSTPIPTPMPSEHEILSLKLKIKRKIKSMLRRIL